MHHQPQQRKIALPNITELWISKKIAPLFVVHASLTGQSRICKSPPAKTRKNTTNDVDKKRSMEADATTTMNDLSQTSKVRNAYEQNVSYNIVCKIMRN